MRTVYEEITLSVDTKKNAVPNGKLMAGRLSVDENGFEASFEEEEGEVAVFKERNAKRIMRGKNCSVWWNPVMRCTKCTSPSTLKRKCASQRPSGTQRNVLTS